jgi:hypothetical protein
LLAEMAAKPQKPVRKELVWSGSDIDGDGAPDFANPTGGVPALPRHHDRLAVIVDGRVGRLEVDRLGAAADEADLDHPLVDACR